VQKQKECELSVREGEKKEGGDILEALLRFLVGKGWPAADILLCILLEALEDPLKRLALADAEGKLLSEKELKVLRKEPRRVVEPAACGNVLQQANRPSVGLEEHIQARREVNKVVAKVLGSSTLSN
jgi:hypothetical protein